MSNNERSSETLDWPAPQVGEPLPGLVVDVSQLPDGTHYWDQVVPSVFGDLYFDPLQYRNGTRRWATNHGEVLVTVESGSGIVLRIDTEALGNHSGTYLYEYEMGIKEYQEEKRKLRDEFPET